MAGTKFSDYLGVKHYKKAKKLNISFIKGWLIQANWSWLQKCFGPIVPYWRLERCPYPSVEGWQLRFDSPPIHSHVKDLKIEMVFFFQQFQLWGKNEVVIEKTLWIFEITWTMHWNSERSDQFLKQNAFQLGLKGFSDLIYWNN